MNKNTIIALSVALLILLFGAGAFFMSQNKTTVKPTTQPVVANPNTKTNNATSSTLKELLASKTPSKCTYSTDAGNTKISGTVYVNGGKVRGDFTTTTDKTTIIGHMATDEKFVYTWMDNSKQGYKFAMDTQAMADKAAQDSQKPDFNQKFNYDCSPWIVDAKMMVLPVDITFTTFTIPVIPTGTTGKTGTINNSSACVACDGLPAGEAKTACLTQLGCN